MRCGRAACLLDERACGLVRCWPSNTLKRSFYGSARLYRKTALRSSRKLNSGTGQIGKKNAAQRAALNPHQRRRVEETNLNRREPTLLQLRRFPLCPRARRFTRNIVQRTTSWTIGQYTKPMYCNCMFILFLYILYVTVNWLFNWLAHNNTVTKKGELCCSAALRRSQPWNSRWAFR